MNFGIKIFFNIIIAPLHKKCKRLLKIFLHNDYAVMRISVKLDGTANFTGLFSKIT